MDKDSEKPKLGITDKIGLDGVDYVRDIVRRNWNCLFRDISGTADRGLDGIVEDLHRDIFTAKIFFVQIKAGKLNWQSGGKKCRPPNVTEKHLSYWRDLNTPVVLICVDLEQNKEAYWTLIRRNQQYEKLFMDKSRVFGPASRLEVMTAIRQEYNKPITPITGDMLRIPLQSGIREFAKTYYRKILMIKKHENDLYGPVDFSWKGWKHLTRQKRTERKIANSLLLLPCIPLVLTKGAFPISFRPFKPIKCNDHLRYKTLFAFERVILFKHRAQARVRVVIEQQVILPFDWRSAPANDSRRKTYFKFLAIYEK